jgi:hypothetical protein
LNIDGCMSSRFAQLLAGAPPWQRVIVIYQDWMWRRDYSGFLATWNRLAPQFSHMPEARSLEYYRMRGSDVHNQIVPIALRRWLPRLVPPPQLTTTVAQWLRGDESSPTNLTVALAEPTRSLQRSSGGR